jgi:hypothetical protein
MGGLGTDSLGLLLKFVQDRIVLFGSGLKVNLYLIFLRQRRSHYLLQYMSVQYFFLSFL